jgi:hypothetical protein
MMLKPLLFGSAMILALPALAQTTNSTGGSTSAGQSGSATGTTTNDHDPTMSDDNAQATGTTGMGSQVNGGTTTSSTGMRTGQTGTGMSNSGTTGGTSDWGTGAGSASTGTGTASGSWSSGASGSYAGRGGPEGGMRAYPPCTRSRTDSCTQMRGRSRR